MGSTGAPNFGSDNAVTYSGHNTLRSENEDATTELRRSTISSTTDMVTMDILDGYLDNLTAAATSKKSVLEQLVDDNKTLVAANAALVATTRKLTSDVKLMKE